MRSLPSRAAGALAVAAALALSGCSLFSSGSPTPSGVATQPPGSGQAGTLSPTATPTGSAGIQTSGERTVLVQDGLRIHSSDSLSASVLGTAAWGVTLTVLGYDASGGPWPDSSTPGGWYHVEGSTVTGWIIADPTYTASGVLSSISFQDKQIGGILFPIDWTYADDQGEIVFEPQTGTQLPTLLIRSAATLNALGALGLTGYNVVSSNAEVVACGYTGTLVQYAASSARDPGADHGRGGRPGDPARRLRPVPGHALLQLRHRHRDELLDRRRVHRLRERPQQHPVPVPRLRGGHRVAEPQPRLSRPGCGRPSSRST